jgi:outer membrane protein assembly factor BamA
MGLQLDKRDNPVYPVKGYWGVLSAERADSFYGSDINMWKFLLDARLYQAINRRNVFAFHLKGGYTTETAPFYERFYLGGLNSLRGYAYSRLTPIGWGTKLLLTQFEYRFPLSKSKFPYHNHTGVLFFDAGGIWLPGQTPAIDDIFTGAGIGYRVKLPLFGITRIDLAVPLRKFDINKIQLYVTFSQTF